MGCGEGSDKTAQELFRAGPTYQTYKVAGNTYYTGRKIP